jgi:hypothetical protein
MVNLLVAASAASILIGPDRVSSSPMAKSCRRDTRSSPVARDRNKATLMAPLASEQRRRHIGSRNFIYTLVPMSGGASGAALIFRHTDPMNEAHASFVTYVRETVFGPLRALRDSLSAAAARPNSDPFLGDATSSLDQVLSSLELAPEVEEASFAVRPVPTVTEVVRRVAERFRAHADLKGIRLDIDVQELEERFADHGSSPTRWPSRGNALHPCRERAVVIGVRWMQRANRCCSS